MMPPRALISSTTMVPAHFTPSPMMAEGPVSEDEKPTRMGAGDCAAAGHAAARTSASERAKRLSMSGLLVGPGRSRRSPVSTDDLQILVRAREPARAGRGDLDGVLHLHAAERVLVVRRLHAEH